MDSWVEVSRPDGTMERHRIEGDQVTVGRSPTAGIPLVNASDMLPEHLLLAPRPDGCWVAVAQGAEPPALVQGRTVTGEVLPWGTEIQVGMTALRVTDKPTPTKKADGKQVGNPVLILAFVAIPLVGWLLLSEPEGDLPLDPGAPHPELFDEPEPCPDQGSAALHRARESAEAASHKSERYPFDAQDGVEAVGLYGTAKVCFSAAGQRSDSSRMDRERTALSQVINEDYRTHRLRLERALKFERYDEALIEARALNALTRHRQGDDYVTWLVLLERQLQLMIDQSLGVQQ